MDKVLEEQLIKHYHRLVKGCNDETQEDNKEKW